MPLTIYHNPRCTKSRETLALLESRGLTPHVVEYLKTPPSAAELTRIVKLLGVPAAAILRKAEAKEAGIDPATYASWTWKYPERIFVPTLQTHLTEKVRERSRIAVARINAISKIIHGINYARITDQPFINFQQTVYIAKKDHARGFKESGYDESRITEFPFVIQHADYANIPFKQAADDILFKAKLHEEMLAQTEILRIKFFNKIKKENDPAAMTQIVSDFYNNRG